MIRPIALLAKILAVIAIFEGTTRAGAPQPELARLKGHVETLASPAFGGRRDDGAAKARAYLIEEFRKLGLEPLFEGKFTQGVTGKGPDDLLGRQRGSQARRFRPGRGRKVG